MNVTLSRTATQPITFKPFLTARSAKLATSSPVLDGNEDFGPRLEWSTNGSSWSAVSGSLSFNPGQTSLFLRTRIVDDKVFEPSEQFDISTGAITQGQVRNPSGAVGTVTITDNDPQILGSLSVVSLQQGKEAGSVANTYRFSRSDANLSQPLVLTYQLDGSAVLDLDYSTPTSSSSTTFNPAVLTGTITIPAGQSSVDLIIPTIDNLVVDGTRSLRVNLQPLPGYTLNASLAQGSILDNDASPNPVVSIGNGNVVEPDIGQTRLVNLSLSMSQAATTNVTINYRAVQATSSDVAGRFGINGQPLRIATPNTDYTPILGSVTLKPGAQSTIIQVPVIGDNIAENDEALYVNITSVTGGNATVSNSANRGEIIIVDNDRGSNNLTLNYATFGRSINIRGGTGNDVITGSRFNDYLDGNEGNDFIEGAAGADTITGGPGADIFAYRAISHSTSRAIDRIRDLTPGNLDEGDRIQFLGSAATALRTATGSASADGLPKAIYNASRSVPFTSLSTAITQAFRDKNLDLPGNQPLGLGEAVIFNQGSRRLVNSYMIVNIGSAGYQPGTDWLVNITGWQSRNFGASQLAVSDFFRSSIG